MVFKIASDWKKLLLMGAMIMFFISIQFQHVDKKLLLMGAMIMFFISIQFQHVDLYCSV